MPPIHPGASMSSSPQLTRLIELAREPSSERRRELLREVSDLFLEKPETYSETERSYFGDIIGHVARELEMTVRKHLAERLAEQGLAPRNLILQLANDEVDVARPVLLKSRVLTEGDLVAIVEIKGQGHQTAVASRPAVSARVADALVAKGSDDTLVALAQNAGAELSRAAMETLVAKSEASPTLQAPLVTRRDLPPDLLNDMFFHVSSQLRAYILERNAGIDEEDIDAALRESHRVVTRDTGAVHDSLKEAEEFIARKAQLRELNESLLIKLLRNKQVPEFLVGFARMVDLDIRTARRALFDRSAEALAVACRAARFDRTTFSTIVLLTQAGHTRTPAQTFELLSMYDKVPVDAAQRTIRFWKARRAAAEPRAA